MAKRKYDPSGMGLEAAEQMREIFANLHRAGDDALAWIVKFKEIDHGMFHGAALDFESCNEPTCQEAQAVVAALREALEPIGEKS